MKLITEEELKILFPDETQRKIAIRVITDLISWMEERSLVVMKVPLYEND